METLSFILGIASVVVIATAVVAVYAFVKVNKVNKHFENLCRELDTTRNDLYRYTAERAEDIIRTLDSRCDKLENKLTNRK
jgi:DNA-binding Xre family transcriptional regulator